MKAIGIDTSCYTTSIAIVDDSGLVADCRQILNVPPMQRGLQQSKAVFQHVGNLPQLFKEIEDRLANLCCVGVSARPRDVEGSYMPVFEAGLSYAQVVASTLGIPLYRFSHQQGHIAAALWGQNDPPQEPFLALHVSGGTTELLHVTPHGHTYDTMISGATSDLNAGQFVDRIGVAMGLSFPAGPALEQLALQAQGNIPLLPVSVKDEQCSFSGCETAAQRLLDAGSQSSCVARAVENCIAVTLWRLIDNHLRRNNAGTLLLAGGVLSNAHIRQSLQSHCAQRNLRLVMAGKGLSSDNAVGIASMAYHFAGGIQ